MRIGTTPTFTFELPADVTGITKVKITFRQSGRLILEKYLSDCTLDGNVIKVSLKQEDTFLFTHSSRVEVQLRVQVAGNVVRTSDVYTFEVAECLDTEVL